MILLIAGPIAEMKIRMFVLCIPAIFRAPNKYKNNITITIPFIHFIQYFWLFAPVWIDLVWFGSTWFDFQ